MSSRFAAVDACSEAAFQSLSRCSRGEMHGLGGVVVAPPRRGVVVGTEVKAGLLGVFAVVGGHRGSGTECA